MSQPFWNKRPDMRRHFFLLYSHFPIFSILTSLIVLRRFIYIQPKNGFCFKLKLALNGHNPSTFFIAEVTILCLDSWKFGIKEIKQCPINDNLFRFFSNFIQFFKNNFSSSGRHFRWREVHHFIFCFHNFQPKIFKFFKIKDNIFINLTEFFANFPAIRNIFLRFFQVQKLKIW